MRIVFGRTGFVVLALLWQLAILDGIFQYIEEYCAIIDFLLFVLGIGIVIYVLNQDIDPGFKFAWIIPLITLPALGAFFYIYFHIQPTVALIRNRLQANINRTKQYLKQDLEVMEKLEANLPRVAGLARYINDYGGYPIYDSSSVEYYPFGEDMFEELKKQLREAKHFILMEYFIVTDGEMWDSILDILKDKVEEGVDVRFMYDGTCAVALVPYDYPKRLAKLGIKCKAFSPIRPFLSSHQNNRDHRKITVIDGHTAFTGGINLADEYINAVHPYGVWKDTAVMIKGPAVKSFTVMFLQMWNIDGNYLADYNRYMLPENYSYKLKGEGSGYVMPYGDSPLDNEQIGKQVYVDILNSAKKYVMIMTPYLIIDNDMCNALRYAAKRGVEVKIILPHIPDKKYAFSLAHSHYPDLLKAGIHIYEYKPGFVHAKMYVSDDVKATVGTINMDYRSLYLHWENGVYFYGNPAVEAVKQDFERTLKDCIKVNMDYYKSLPVLDKAMGKILKVFAPLM